MMHSVLFLVLAAVGFGHSTNPKPPSLTYLLSANITVGTPIPIGNVPLGSRVVIPVAGGSFSGPKLNGKIPAVGGDWGLTDASGKFSPDALFVLQTTDGANILVRGAGHFPFEGATFETGNEKYAWLNTAVGVAKSAQVDGGITMDIFVYE